jgi:hypothetical protein
MGRMPKTYEATGTDITISIPARRHDVLADILIDAVRASVSGEDASLTTAMVAPATSISLMSRAMGRLADHGI